jgi:hypothetical protein
MIEIPEKIILNVKSKPHFEKGIELKGLEDIEKLMKVGNLVCVYEDAVEKIYFIQNFFYIKKK